MCINSLKIIAPAKVNLSLEILGKYENGYHYINSIVSPISLADELSISIAKSEHPQINFSCNFSEQLEEHMSYCVKEKLTEEINLIKSNNNLAVKAVDLFLNKLGYDSKYAVNIDLKKHIPFGAGLGGGSSDAAAVLRALVLILKCDLKTTDLLKIAGELGSDVPALLFDRTVFVEGKGEKISFLRANKETAVCDYLPVVILKPTFSNPTADLYEKLSAKLNPRIIEENKRLKASDKTNSLIKAMDLHIEDLEFEQNPYNHLTFSQQEGSSPGRKNEHREKLYDFFYNDFEQIVFSQNLDFENCLSCLKKLGALKILLAGSGSAIVAFQPSIAIADQTAELARQQLPKGTFVCSAKVHLNVC